MVKTFGGFSGQFVLIKKSLWLLLLMCFWVFNQAAGNRTYLCVNKLDRYRDRDEGLCWMANTSNNTDYHTSVSTHYEPSSSFVNRALDPCCEKKKHKDISESNCLLGGEQFALWPLWKHSIDFMPVVSFSIWKLSSPSADILADTFIIGGLEWVSVRSLECTDDH